MEESKKKMYVNRDGFCAEASMLFMALAMVFLLIGSIGRWDNLQYLITQVALPVFGGLLFLLLVLVAGRKAFWTTVIPVLLIAAYFVFRAMGMTEENELKRVGLIFFFLVIVVLYALAFSQHWMKWLLAAVLLGIFLFRVVIMDVPVLLDAEKPVLFMDGVQEMSILAVTLSMLFITLAMRTVEKPVKRKAAKPAEEKPAEPEKKPEPQPVYPEPAPEPAYQEPVYAEPVYPEPAPEPMYQEPAYEEPEPQPAYEEPAVQPLFTEPEPEEPPMEEVPIRELNEPAEPAPAYPLEEIAAEPAKDSAQQDGAETV